MVINPALIHQVPEHITHCVIEPEIAHCLGISKPSLKDRFQRPDPTAKDLVGWQEELNRIRISLQLSIKQVIRTPLRSSRVIPNDTRPG